MAWFDVLEAYPAWQRYTVVGALICIIIGGFYVLQYDPALEEIAQHNKKIEELDAKINKGLAMKDKLEDFRKEVFQLKERMRLAAEVLGNRPNVDLLVKSIENISQQCGMTNQKFQPLPERRKQFYGEIPVKLELTGSYHQLGYFFDKVSNETRIMNINDLQIQSAGESGSTISASCNLTAFWFLAKE